MVIAIDGPAGAGKSTVARSLAKELGFVYLDTGAIYRALTLKALEKNIGLKDEAILVQMCKNTELVISNDKDFSIKIILDGQDVSQKIRSPRITQYVSDLAKISGVRTEMLKLQRSIGSSNDSVIDGRDIGTVVFPNADKKFYLDAEFSERVKRRFKESKAAGNPVSLEEVEADLKYRDRIDSTRSCAPLSKADDAIYVDTTNMTVEEVVNAILKEING
jgi:cytidylate kinase